jgi:hypothetical protein
LFGEFVSFHVPAYAKIANFRQAGRIYSAAQQYHALGDKTNAI